MTGAKKKGLSIGAAMKQRMDEQATPESPQTAPSPEPPLDRGGVQPAAPAEAEMLESFNTRLPRGLHRRLKVYAATEGYKLQDVVAQALDEYLRRMGQKES